MGGIRVLRETIDLELTDDTTADSVRNITLRNVEINNLESIASIKTVLLLACCGIKHPFAQELTTSWFQHLNGVMSLWINRIDEQIGFTVEGNKGDFIFNVQTEDLAQAFGMEEMYFEHNGVRPLEGCEGLFFSMTQDTDYALVTDGKTFFVMIDRFLPATCVCYWDAELERMYDLDFDGEMVFEHNKTPAVRKALDWLTKNHIEDQRKDV